MQEKEMRVCTVSLTNASHRAGYSHMNAGYQQQQPNPGFFNSLEPQKWRSRV